MSVTRAKRSALSMVLCAIALGGCPQQSRYTRAQAQDVLRQLEAPGLEVGEFKLARHAVADGDTLRVEHLHRSLRLLHIDTEETFKKDYDRRLYEIGWDAYLVEKRGDSPRPVKMATPLGEEAKKFAERFFSGAGAVRLERDQPKEIRGRYNRYLVYVFAHKDGRWQNYNLECVRSGMSPYFTKYGYSQRFHEEFIAAQAEARAKGVGIWDPGKQHYPDYDERIEWWNARADFIRGFTLDAKGRDNYIVLTHWDAMRRLEAHEGEEVVLLGSVGKVYLGDRGPTVVRLSRRENEDFPIVFFDNDVFGSSRIARYKGEFVRVTGPVTRYRNKRTGREELQIQVTLPGQVFGSERMRDYSDWERSSGQKESHAVK